jgi:hypothetical protein
MTTEAQSRALPAQPSLEHLRKEAKQQLAILRSRAASVQLTDAQLVVARSYGFSSWRALKTEVDRRRAELGILPPPVLDQNFYRSRTVRPPALNAMEAEQSFFRVVTLPFLVGPALLVPTGKIAGLILALLLG